MAEPGPPEARGADGAVEQGPGGMELEPVAAPMNQEDSWVIIDSFFAEKGLVFQQLGSFDQFVMYDIQRLIDQQPPIEITPQNQYKPDENIDTKRCFEWKF